MKQMSLSQVCNLYGFTRRVIQGYEKEGLIKNSGKNKFGHLMYDEDQIKKIAYIRLLQINGLSLKEINACLKTNTSTLLSILKACNCKHKQRIYETSELIKKNEKLIKLCLEVKDLNKIEDEIIELIMEEIKK